MKSYFNKLFTGYSIEKREVRGQKILYKYRGRLTFFDPLLMIQECQYRTADSMTYEYELLSSCEEIQKLLPQPSPTDKPSVICEFSKEDQKWLVSRYSLKHENRVVSHYRFEVDGDFMGSLYRVYDNGNFTLNYAWKIASAIGGGISLSAEKNFWKSKTGQQIFIEKFGHTQIWLWANPLSSLLKQDA